VTRVDLAFSAINEAIARLEDARDRAHGGDLRAAVRQVFVARSYCGKAKTVLEDEIDLRVRVGLRKDRLEASRVAPGGRP